MLPCMIVRSFQPFIRGGYRGRVKERPWNGIVVCICGGER